MSTEPEGERGGFLAFLKDTWIWWLAPLVIALAVVLCLLYYSEADATSPFIYDNF
jgi:hypothetical protein